MLRSWRSRHSRASEPGTLDAVVFPTAVRAPTVPRVPPDSVLLPANVAAAIAAAARTAAPREFVALLAGHLAAAGGTAAVQALHELPNVATGDDTYDVPAAAFAAAEARARADSQTFLGFVHSHPHGLPVPSAHDRSAWWRHCVQLIVGGSAIANGAVALRAYWLDAAGMQELPLRVRPDDVLHPFAAAGAR